MKKLFLSSFGLKRKEQTASWFTSHVVGIRGCKNLWLDHYHPNHKNTIKSTGKPRVDLGISGKPGDLPLQPLGWGGEDSPFLQPPFWLSFLSALPAATGPPAPLNPRSYRTSSQKTSLAFTLCNQPVPVRRHQACIVLSVRRMRISRLRAYLSFYSVKLVALVSLHHLQHPFGNAKA